MILSEKHICLTSYFAEISDNEIDALDLFQVRLSEELDYNAVIRGLVREKIFTKTINFEVRYKHEIRHPSVECVMAAAVDLVAG